MFLSTCPFNQQLQTQWKHKNDKMSKKEAKNLSFFDEFLMLHMTKPDERTVRNSP